MVTLLLLRHAKSSWDDPAIEDFDRPLNGRGRRAALRLARHIADASPRPDLILSSPSRRTRDTLAPIVEAIGGAVRVRFEHELYLATAETLLDRVRAAPPRTTALMLVGHNPGLHDLALLLAGAGDPALRRRLEDKLPTGGLATLTIDAPWPRAVAGAARLVGFVTPRDLHADGE